MGFFIIITNSCKQDDNNAPSNTVKDIDGNAYNTVTIGTQIWMKENLKTTRFRDGTAIPNITDNTEWTNQTTGAYCWYNNDTANKTTYGALYNWYTVVDSRKLCPTGWHVPKVAEWTRLTTYLGGEIVAGGKLKAITLWNSPNTDADNSSGFTALPGGFRGYSPGYYDYISNNGYWWSASADYATTAWGYILNNNGSRVRLSNLYGKNLGYSVRCIRD